MWFKLRKARTEHFVIPAEKKYLAQIRDFTTKYAKRNRFSRKEISSLKISIDEIPEELVQAIVATEDDTYYENIGLDASSLLAALFAIGLTAEAAITLDAVNMRINAKQMLMKINFFFMTISPFQYF